MPHPPPHTHTHTTHAPVLSEHLDEGCGDFVVLFQSSANSMDAVLEVLSKQPSERSQEDVGKSSLTPQTLCPWPTNTSFEGSVYGTCSQYHCTC